MGHLGVEAGQGAPDWQAMIKDMVNESLINAIRDGRETIGWADVEIDEGDDASPYRRQPEFLSGGGGLVSTAADYLRFVTRDGGEKRFGFFGRAGT